MCRHTTTKQKKKNSKQKISLNVGNRNKIYSTKYNNEIIPRNRVATYPKSQREQNFGELSIKRKRRLSEGISKSS